MEILWVPLQEIICKETIQLIDNRNFKKDVMVILKSIDKKIEKKKTTKPMGFTKKLKLKSPSPPKRFRTRTSSASSHTTVRKNSNQTEINLSQSATTTFVVELNQATNVASFNFSAVLSPLSTRNSNLQSAQSEEPPILPQFTGKENKSPNSPNVSNLFDQIKFTPIAQNDLKSNVDYLANLPTPKATNELISKTPKPMSKLPQTSTAHKRLSPYSPSSRPSTTNLFDMETPKGLTRQMSADTTDLSTKIESFQPNFVSSTRRSRSLSEIPDSEHDFRKNLFNVPQALPQPIQQQLQQNRTYKICDGTTASPKELNSSPKPQEFPLNMTIATLAGLTAILEESAPLIQETFNISPQVSKAAASTGTPLRKKFQSMKDLSNDVCLYQQQIKLNQGSMPNLNDYSQVKIFENNRYFNREEDNQSNSSVCSTISTVSTHEVVFNKNEIKAQSSRFNINEIGKHENGGGSSFFFDMTQNTGSSNNRRDDCFVAPRQLSFAPPRKFIAPSATGHKRAGDTGKYVQQKRTKLEETDDSGRSTSSSQSSNSRHSSWGGARRKISLNTTQLILKKQREERVIMFDPDLHIQSNFILFNIFNEY